MAAPKQPSRKISNRLKSGGKPAGRSLHERPLHERSLHARLFHGVLAIFGRHPRLVSGLAVFGIVYSFIAANALWYQQGVHPAPILAMRAMDGAQTSNRAKPTENDNVSLFKIEREAPGNRADTKPLALVSAIQKALTRRFLYDGPTDGIIGPKTTAAIMLFEETEGLKPLGEPTKALLARLVGRNDTVTIADESQADPIAGLIRKNNEAKEVSSAVTNALVLKIQKGLRKVSYEGVTLDGIAGEQTRSAIRSFEKQHHLPVTGEPSEIVLKKLLAIGAI